jgi:hypothetical protein
VREGSSMYRRLYVASVAKCLLYHASINRLANIRLTDDFYNAVVNGLPRTPNVTKYLDFISVFGTHYVSAVDMGSKAAIRSEFEEAAWMKLSLNDFNFKASAKWSFLAMTAGGSLSVASNQQQAQTFDSNRTSMTAAYMGCRPSSDGRWETWMESTALSPYPISYTLRPITELFTAQYFPNVSAEDLAYKLMNLNDTMNMYCTGTPGCGPPLPDRIPIMLDKPEAAISGSQRVSCRPGMYLLSCGLGNMSPIGSAESRRRSIPTDSLGCACFADQGALCQPWCTNVVTGFELKISSYMRGDFRVDCSKDKRVTLCNCYSPADRVGKYVYRR